jgi:hypothetical protein
LLEFEDLLPIEDGAALAEMASQVSKDRP